MIGIIPIIRESRRSQKFPASSKAVQRAPITEPVRSLTEEEIVDSR